jgi:hypothetical protein
MAAQRFVVLLDGEPCAVGLDWRSALVQAGVLLEALSLTQPDHTVVTISELTLDEPRISWLRKGRCWDCHAEPEWLVEAA